MPSVGMARWGIPTASQKYIIKSAALYLFITSSSQDRLFFSGKARYAKIFVARRTSGFPVKLR
jgi:hypothetical protein